MSESKIIYPEGVKPDVLSYEDIVKMAPKLEGHRKLVEWALHALRLDEVNGIHRRNAYSTGVDFSHNLVDKEFKYKLRIDNYDVLSRFPDQPFITVSNHPYGGIDGILLLHVVGTYRRDYKVMVNMLLNHITAMRDSFIAVDPQKSDDPEKKRVTMQGIRAAIAHVRGGHPIGFFPAGAVSKFNNKLQITDREWQPTIIRLIQQLKVPVIPIYFHGRNSIFFNMLGLIDWRIRSAYLPRELLTMNGDEFHISFGEPISPEVQAQYPDIESLGKFLREKTYSLKKKYK